MKARSSKGQVRRPRLKAGKQVGLVEPGSHAAFKERLRALVDQFGSIFALASAAGVSDTSIHLWLRGSEPGRDKLVRLTEAAGVSLEWLLRGHGPMRADLLPEGYRLIRTEQNVELDAEPGSSDDHRQSDYLAFKSEWIAKLGVPSEGEGLVVTPARGDAMLPVIAPGDLLLIDYRNHGISEDGIYAIVVQGDFKVGVLVRRVQNRADGTVELSCDNPDYPARENLSRDSFGRGKPPLHFFCRILWSGGRR